MENRDYTELICNRIAQLRIKKGISARDMSLSLGQSESYINKIENKKALPSMKVFFMICEYFKLKPKDFLSDEYQYPSEMIAAIHELSRLNEDQLTRVTALLKDINRK